MFTNQYNIVKIDILENLFSYIDMFCCLRVFFFKINVLAGNLFI